MAIPMSTTRIRADKDGGFERLGQDWHSVPSLASMRTKNEALEPDAHSIADSLQACYIEKSWDSRGISNVECTPVATHTVPCSENTDSWWKCNRELSAM